MSLYIMQSKHYRWSRLICLFAWLKWKRSDVNPAEVSPDYSRVLKAIIARRKKGGSRRSVSEEEVLRQVDTSVQGRIRKSCWLCSSPQVLIESSPPFFKSLFHFVFMAQMHPWCMFGAFSKHEMRHVWVCVCGAPEVWIVVGILMFPSWIASQYQSPLSYF